MWGRLFGRKSQAPQPAEAERVRASQNARIRDLHRDWQLAWHDLFDADPVLADSEEFARPVSPPNNISEDWRLVFGLSRAAAPTRADCLRLMPQGAEMARRLEHYLTTPTPALTLDSAKGRIGHLKEVIRQVDLVEPLIWEDPQVIGVDAPFDLMACSGIEGLFAGNLLAPLAEDDVPLQAAQLFLKEPLYATAGNYYELCDWVTGPLMPAERAAACAALYRMWAAGWQVMAGPNGEIALRPV